MVRNPFTKTLGVAAGMLLTVAVFVASALDHYSGAGADHLGASIAFGDVDGDGRHDVIIGADAGGYVSVYSGEDLSTPTQLYQFVSDSDRPGDNFGIALAV